MRLMKRALAFNADQRDAAHKVALHQEKDEEHGQRDDDGAGHQAGSVQWKIAMKTDEKRK